LNESTLVSKGPCAACGSSDANATYDDGHTYCFACGTHVNGEGESSTPAVPGLQPVEYTPLPARKISEDTCRKFRYGTANGCHFAGYVNDKGQLVAQKRRTRDKEMSWIGKPKQAGLFGQHLWGSGGKMIVVTEGEIDALSVAEIGECKWPVVSIPNGAPSAVRDIERSLEFLERFDEVVFMFDMDALGQEAAVACAELITPGKAKIATLPLKDASDMLVAGRRDELRRAQWQARPYRPDGIITGAELWDRVVNSNLWDATPTQWEGLNNLVKGLRPGALWTIVAGTGVGKSEVARQIAAHYHDNHDWSIGNIFLEESVERTALGYAGLAVGKRLHVDGLGGVDADLEQAWKTSVASGRMFFYDHFGSLEPGNLVARVRYMAKADGCNLIIVDNITVSMAGAQSQDERKAIDEMVAKLRSLAQEANVAVIIVAHVRRHDGTPTEEGGRVTLNDIRGSQAVGGFSNIVIGLERNQQHEDPEKRDRTTVRVLKNRETGDVGKACQLLYDKKTGRLQEVVDEPEVAEAAEGEEVPF